MIRCYQAQHVTIKKAPELKFDEKLVGKRRVPNAGLMVIYHCVKDQNIQHA